MIDKDLLDSLEPASSESAKQALVSLSLSGIWQLQEQQLIARLAEGFHLNEEDLVKRVKSTQESILQCRTMQGLGDELRKERTNA